MPGGIRKIKSKGRTRHRVTWGGKTTAKATTKRKAEAQLRLLTAIEHGCKPTGKKAKRR